MDLQGFLDKVEVEMRGNGDAKCCVAQHETLEAVMEGTLR